jgi:hypothetical protein
MSETSKGYWFQFSLKKFFVVLTVLMLWLCWNSYQVRQRQQVEKYIVMLAARNPPIVYGEPVKPWRSIPIGWRLLGVKPVQYLILPRGTVEEDRAQIRKWFPEADILSYGD